MDAALFAWKAVALRKLGRLDDALQMASRVIREVEALEKVEADGDPGPAALDALVSAHCCTGYCHLEKGRAGEDTLERAIEDLDRAAAVAVAAEIPVQPRISTGLGYVYTAPGAGARGSARVRPGVEGRRGQPEGDGGGREWVPHWGRHSAPGLCAAGCWGFR